MLKKEVKQAIIKKYATHEGDTGSAEVQVAVLTEEINALTYKKKLPNWLIANLKKNEGYWTMTSATGFKTSYSQGAIALANVDKKASIESLKVQKKYEEDYLYYSCSDAFCHRNIVCSFGCKRCYSVCNSI